MTSRTCHIFKMWSKVIKGGTFYHNLEEKNVSAAVASDEIDIFHVILHDNVIMWFSIIKKKTTKELVSSAQFYENTRISTEQLPFVKV